MKKRNIALALLGGVTAAVAVKLLTRPETVDFETVADEVPHSDRSHFVSVDGIRLHYQDFGAEDAPSVILIHGYTASVYVWKTVAPMLASLGLRVIAVDLVGFGYSEKPRGFDYRMQSQARIIGRLMDRLGIGRTAIVGSSYGGAVAQFLSLDMPERVKALVLSDSVINDDQKKHPILRLASLAGIGEVITPFLVDSKFFMRRRMHGTLAETHHDLITQDRVDSIVRPLAAADAHHSVLAASRAWDASQLEEDMHLIKQPTLIIWGDSDKVIPLANGCKLQMEIPNSRLIVFKDCGHVPQEECSETFADVVADFILERAGH